MMLFILLKTCRSFKGGCGTQALWGVRPGQIREYFFCKGSLSCFWWCILYFCKSIWRGGFLSIQKKVRMSAVSDGTVRKAGQYGLFLFIPDRGRPGGAYDPQNLIFLLKFFHISGKAAMLCHFFILEKGEWKNMAIHNYVSLFGVVRTAPQIKTGMYGRTAMVAVTVVRGDRKEDTMLLRTSLKYSSPI